MAQAETNTIGSCEFCDKRGLPLLLVRDGVAPASGGAPLTNDPHVELALGAVHYTKRLLRTGYVNVFDEARKRWETYFVTADGYLSKMAQKVGATPVVPAKPFNCPDEGHRAIASCISIPDPKNASKFWIGFSDVAWTDAVRKKHGDAAYRRRHMVEIDVQAALAGGKVGNARPIAQVNAVVAEYAMDSRKGTALFTWNPFKFDPRNGRGERVIRECDAMRPGKGLIVTLADPAAIAQELALLMTRNADLFTGNTENRRNLAVSGQINEIETAVRVAAEHRKIQIVDARIQTLIDQKGIYCTDKTKVFIRERYKVTAEQLKEASDSAWEKYDKKFNDKARARWDASFKVRLKEFDSKFISPLALSHAQWMKSEAMLSYFECNFDPAEPEIGAVYTNVFTRCITGTQDKVACFAVYDEWMSGSVGDSKNLLLQAMILNQKVIADAVIKATTVDISLRMLPWDNFFAVSNNHLGRLADAATEAASRVLVQALGPYARAMGKVLEGKIKRFRELIMISGFVSRHPIVLVQITANVKAFRAHVVTQLLLASGKVVDKKKLATAVKAELNRMQVKGVDMAGTTKKAFLVPLDLDAIKNIPGTAAEQQTIDELAKSLRTLEDVERLDLMRWRQVISRDLGFGVVTAILQAICLTKLFEDEDKALENEKFDATARRSVGASALVATIAEAIGKSLSARAAQGLRYAPGLVAGAGAFLRVGGRVGGLLVGFGMVLLDLRKYSEAQKENQQGLAWLYMGSAIVGASLSYFIFIGAAIPLIGILVAIIVGISLLIEYIKDNPVQDWLERTQWGILPAQRYADFETEQAQLQKALSS